LAYKCDIIARMKEQKTESSVSRPKPLIDEDKRFLTKHGGLVMELIATAIINRQDRSTKLAIKRAREMVEEREKIVPSFLC